MAEHGSLWQKGAVFVERVEVRFNPPPTPICFSGTITYTGHPIVKRGVYVLKMDDGVSQEIAVEAPSLQHVPEGDILQVSANFNKAG